MECNKDLDTKYQNLATEFSKLRANAAVLKKALLDEQGKSQELKSHLKENEQRLRKSNQEMESLTFRNQQLTKRISVLQEDLEIATTGKRNKGKSNDSNQSNRKSTNFTLLDEELQKKIMDNAQLISQMTDKELEISNLKEIITELEEKLLEERKMKASIEQKYETELNLLREKHSKSQKIVESDITFEENKQNGDAASGEESITSNEDSILRQQNLELQQEAERWKNEYKLLLSQNELNSDNLDNIDKKTLDYYRDYYYKRLDTLIAERQVAESESRTLVAENDSLQIRLDKLIQDKIESDDKIQELLNKQKSLQDELQITSHNYEQQLSTMSEHLADLNDKYTEQCEFIQQLMYQINQTPHPSTTKSKKSNK